jgi:hypothetical protein
MPPSLAMAEVLDWISAGATSAAAGAAAWAAWQASRSTSQNAALVRIERERWETDREARRHADVIPFFESRDNSLRLVIRNRGPAEAREVQLTDDTSETGDLVFEIDEVFPVPRLPAGAERVVLVRAIPGSGLIHNIHLSWIDDSGPHGESHRLSSLA